MGVPLNHPFWIGIFHDKPKPAIGEPHEQWKSPYWVVVYHFEGVAGPQGTGATRKCWGPWIAQDIFWGQLCGMDNFFPLVLNSIYPLVI